jgi:hypothetical protein
VSNRWRRGRECPSIVISVSGSLLDLERHPLTDAEYVVQCRIELETSGALVLPGLVGSHAIASIVAESSDRETDAFYANSTHNVFLTDPDPALAPDHPLNRQVESSKGLIADDQIPAGSPLRSIYGDPLLRSFLCGVLGLDAIYPYADEVSSINVHFAPNGRELGWHVDNSSFAVTMLLRSPEDGGSFEYVADIRGDGDDEAMHRRVDGVLDGVASVQVLAFDPGDLVVFRGRNAIHRVTPTLGNVTRMLVVFAFNDQPGVALSESALTTFYGRTA